MKYFRMSYEEIVFKRSYVNIMLLNKSIPNFHFDDDKDDDRGDDEDEYTKYLRTAKKKPEKKAPKVKHEKPKTQHANDFFSQFM